MRASFLFWVAAATTSSSSLLLVVQGWQLPNSVDLLNASSKMDGELICRVTMESSWRMNALGEMEPEKKAMCSPVMEDDDDEEDNVDDDEDEMLYDLDLPQWMMSQYQGEINQGSLYVKIPGGQVVNDYILIPSDSTVLVMTEQQQQQYQQRQEQQQQLQLLQQQQRRHLQQSGATTKKLMVARVSLTDSQVGFSQSDLQEYIFGSSTSAVSVTNQFAGCSSNKLTLAPSDLGSVVDIFVNQSITEFSSWRLLRNAAALELKNFFGTFQLTSVADYVILCLPPGNWNFMASTTTGYWRSTYDDKYCGYLSVVMHQLGYSMGLGDSNEVKPLQDTTCYMGEFSTTVGSPQKCFNAQKHWLLGWFSDRATTITPTTTPQVVSLASFLEYSSTESSDIVVLNIGNLYLQYNQATGFNVGTGENKNQVVIVQGDSSNVQSDKLAGLDLSNPTLNIPNFSGGSNLIIEVCQFNTTRLDIAIVSVALGTCACQCSTVAPSSGSTTLAPSSVVATTAPSLGTVTTIAPSSLATTLAPSSLAVTTAPSSLATTLAPSSLAATTSVPSSVAPSTAPAPSGGLPTASFITEVPTVVTSLNETNTTETTTAPSVAPAVTTTSAPSLLNITTTTTAPKAPTSTTNSTRPTRPTIFNRPPAPTSVNSTKKPVLAESPSSSPIKINGTLSPKVHTLYPTPVHADFELLKSSSISLVAQVSHAWIILVGFGVLLL